MFATSLFIDIFFTTLPFLLLHILLWFAAMFAGICYTLISTKTDTAIKINKPTLPSPFFPKSAYLWHSQFRVFLPALWLFMAAIAIIARVHDNFNLAIVVFCGGIFISLLSVILQKEESDFIVIYLNSSHFRKRTTMETLLSTTIVALPLSIALLVLFPSGWWIILLSTASILLISLNLLWIKYIFYPSILLASLFFFVGMAIQAICVFSIYTLVLIPIYNFGLYFLFKRRTDNYFAQNERINY